MKAIIIGITAVAGLLGGAVSMVNNNDAEEGAQGYSHQPVQYLEFTEPMEITGRVQHINFTLEEAEEALSNVK